MFFLSQSGAPFRQSVVERLVDSAWLATQRAWPNLNTGPKLPDDFRAKLSVKWQNRWPDVLYHNAILQGALRSALLGREVEASVTATFRPPALLPKTRSALPLKSLSGTAGGGPLDWRAPAAAAAGAFLSHVSASGFEYGQMEMMREWTQAVHGSDAYRAAYLWAEVGVRLPGEVALMGASMIPGVGEAMDAHSSIFGETALERNLARLSLVVSAYTAGLSPNFGRVGRAIGEIGGEVGRVGRRGVEWAGYGTTTALRAAERASLAAARHGARAVGSLAGGVRTAGNYAAAFERGYLRGAAKYAGQLNCRVDPTPFFRGVLEGAREARALHNAPRITAEIADTAGDLARTERHATAALTDAAERTTAAKHIWEARRILAETRPDLSIIDRNAIIKGFDLPTFRVKTVSSELGGFRYYDGVNAQMGGRWSTPQWLARPSERISVLALPNNAATSAASVRLLPGSTIFEGAVAPQLRFGPNLTGGGWQWYQASGPRAVITPVVSP